MRTLLVEASPRDPATGAVVPVRLVQGGVNAYKWRGFTDWRGGVVSYPSFTARLDFGDAGWTGGATPQTAAIEFSSADLALVPSLAALYWNGAEITLRSDDDEAANPTWPVLMSATVATASQADGVLTLTIGDMATTLNKPLAPALFQGTGGLEGSAETIGRTKRRTFGAAFNIEARILDPAYLIYELGDPSKPLTSINAVRDRGRQGPLEIVAWQGTAAATLAALKSAAVFQGGGVVAPSIACVKWWTTAAGPLTADVNGETAGGGQSTAPDIASVLAGLAGLTIANLAAAQTARPALVGIHIGDSTETIGGAIDRLLVGSSLLWVLNPEGTIRLEQWSFTDSLGDGEVEELISYEVSRLTYYPPIKGRKFGYKPNNRPMNAGEISPAVTDGDAAYDDGTPIDDLKPAEAGATKGATGNAPFGDAANPTSAAQAIANLTLNGRNALAAVLQGPLLQADLNARTVIGDKDIATVVNQLSQQVSDGTSGLAQTLALLGAGNADNSAFIINALTTQVAPGKNLAQSIFNLESSSTDFDASITRLDEILTDKTGTSLRVINVLNLNGAVTGTYNTLTKEYKSEYVIVTDVFKLVRPGGGQPIIPFQVRDDGTVEMPNVEVGTLKYSALVPLLGGQYNLLDPTKGFQDFPGGLTMQWGQVRQSINDEVTLSVVFPKAFPNKCVSRGAMPFLNTYSTNRDLWMQNVGSASVSGATFATQAGTSNSQNIDGFDWWAWGY